MRPGGQLGLGDAAALPLMVAVYAVFQILTSRLARTEDPMTMHFYTGWVGAIAMSAVVPLGGAPSPTATPGTPVSGGTDGHGGHFLLILAYGCAPASTLSPHLYCQIGLAMLAGWLVFDHARPAGMDGRGPDCSLWRNSRLAFGARIAQRAALKIRLRTHLNLSVASAGTSL